METAARETDPAPARAIADLRLTAVRQPRGGAEDVRRGRGGGRRARRTPQAASSGCAASSSYSPRLAAAPRAATLVHSLGSTAPLRGAFKRVTTIHDLNYRIVPESHFGVRGLGMRVLVPAAARRSHRIIVDAESTRDDLRDLLKVDPPARSTSCRSASTPRRGRAHGRRPSCARGSTSATGPWCSARSAKRPHKNLLAACSRRSA